MELYQKIAPFGEQVLIDNPEKCTHIGIQIPQRPFVTNRTSEEMADISIGDKQYIVNVSEILEFDDVRLGSSETNISVKVEDKRYVILDLGYETES